jgi:glycerol-3-phosphate dehydrogenase (NAD(P)+)
MSVDTAFRNIAVLGAGRWGSAVAVFLAERGCRVTLWAFEDEVVHSIRLDRTNPFLPGVRFPSSLEATRDIEAAARGRDLIVLAVPCQFLRGTLRALGRVAFSSPILGINKGLEQDTAKTIPEIVRETLGPRPYAHLGGPCFPDGLLDPNTPVAETVASEDPELARAVQELFAWRNFRPYRSGDVRGVAVLGALKNVYAIGAGIASGLGLGQESLAGFVTRALAELRRLALSMGIPEASVVGLSGLGDLMLTCYSPTSSRNRNLGMALGRGMSIDAALGELAGKVAEGYFTASCVRALATRHSVEMPIADGIYRVLYEGALAAKVVAELMDRPLRAEA